MTTAKFERTERRHADAAMYCAKQRGRGNVQCFAVGMNAGAEDRVQLESDLHSAITLNQFQLYYQAQVEATGRMIGAEVLLRWPHPQRGMVSPLEFIPLAERHGAIAPITRWVLDRVLNGWRYGPERDNRAKLVFLVEAVFDPAAAADLHPGQPVDVSRAD